MGPMLTYRVFNHTSPLLYLSSSLAEIEHHPTNIRTTSTYRYSQIELTVTKDSWLQREKHVSENPCSDTIVELQGVEAVPAKKLLSVVKVNGFCMLVLDNNDSTIIYNQRYLTKSRNI